MYRKVQYFMGTSIVSCQFPLKQIHWYSLHTMITNHTIHTYHTVILWWFMFVTPATLVPHREKPGWKKTLRYAPLRSATSCPTGSVCHGQLDTEHDLPCILHICMYSMYVPIYICIRIIYNSMYMCIYTCMYVCIYIYMLYGYVGMCDKHERSIEVCRTSQRIALFVPMVFVKLMVFHSNTVADHINPQKPSDVWGRCRSSMPWCHKVMGVSP